jgi:Tol biopolymer transport system component
MTVDRHPHSTLTCRSRRALLVAIVVTVVLAATLAACGGSPSPGPTVTVTVSPSSASASPFPTASGGSHPLVPKQLAIAVASGSAANGVSVIGSAGQVKQLVAPHLGPIGGPIEALAWSPDAWRLAYAQAPSTTDYLGGPGVWIYDVATRKTRQIASKCLGFAWVGPTRLLIAVNLPGQTSGYRVNGTLYVYDVTTGTRTPVKDGAGHTVLGAHPTASADGASIAFVHYDKASGGKIPEQLMLYDADTLAVSQVASGKAWANVDSDIFSFPSLSPDGKYVYACQTGSDPAFRSTVYRVDGSKAYSSPPLIWPTNGAWDAKSARLAFGGVSGTAYPTAEAIAINVWPVGAAKATAVLAHKTTGGGFTELSWTPLGKQIVYTLPSNSAQNGDIWIVNADGSNKHLLMHNGSYPACAMAPISFK